MTTAKGTRPGANGPTGAVTYPPDFDPKKKYPVWVLTYAGPGMPILRDEWAALDRPKSWDLNETQEG